MKQTEPIEEILTDKELEPEVDKAMIKFNELLYSCPNGRPRYALFLDQIVPEPVMSVVIKRYKEAGWSARYKYDSICMSTDLILTV